MLLSRYTLVPLVMLTAAALAAPMAEAQDTVASQPRLPKRLVGTADEVSRAELVRPMECAGLSFKVHRRSRSLSESSCALALRAKRAIANGEASYIGVNRADTANIEIAMIGRNVIKDVNGREVTNDTSVTLNIRGRDYALVLKLSAGEPARVVKTERLHLPLLVEKDE